jgi:hypothetical protein
MSRRARREQRLLKEQDTVGMRRAERKELEELAGKKKIEASMTKAQRMMELQKKENDLGAHPPRIARPGKPLIR